MSGLRLTEAYGADKCERCGAEIQLFSPDGVVVVHYTTDSVYVMGHCDPGDQMLWYEQQIGVDPATGQLAVIMLEHTKERCDAHRRGHGSETESETS